VDVASLTVGAAVTALYRNTWFDATVMSTDAVMTHGTVSVTYVCDGFSEAGLGKDRLRPEYARQDGESGEGEGDRAGRDPAIGPSKPTDGEGDWVAVETSHTKILKPLAVSDNQRRAGTERMRSIRLESVAEHSFPMTRHVEAKVARQVFQNRFISPFPEEALSGGTYADHFTVIRPGRNVILKLQEGGETKVVIQGNALANAGQDVILLEKRVAKARAIMSTNFQPYGQR